MSAVEGTASRGSASPSRLNLEWAMFFLALLMVPLVLIQLTATNPDILLAAEIANAVIWLAFVAELVVFARRAPSRGAFIRQHWLDISIVVLSPPLFVPPQLASLRLLRLLRLVRLLAIIGRLQQGTGRATGRQGLAYVGILVLFFIFFGGVSLHELEPEKAPTVWEGIWWAIVTLTTVGYGDITPVTFEGRALAAVLMFVGLGAFGTLAGSVGAMFLGKSDDSDQRLERIESALLELRDRTCG